MNRDTYPYWPTPFPGLAFSIAGRQSEGIIEDLAVNLIPEYDDTQITDETRAGVYVPGSDSQGYTPVFGQRPGGLFDYLGQTMQAVPDDEDGKK